MSDKKVPESKYARDLIHQLVVVEGRSYDDAIGRLERRGDEAAEPFREAAEALRSWLPPKVEHHAP